MNETALLLASANTGKIEEFRSFLSDLSIRILSLHDIGSKSAYHEKGTSFRENAAGKSLFYSREWPGLILGEDSGLMVDALDGAPGIYSARFAGPKAADQDNIRKLLEKMNGLPPAQRKARFISCLVLSKQGRIIYEIEKNVRGLILDHPEGNQGFGYDPVFFYPPLGKTFAQISPSEKNLISHRGKALRALKEMLLRMPSS
ncbi:MAG: RdgB/HAM1 family non-canonical purine NTP pyrophosphatase [Candidatus Aminicenantes bacterium]